MPAHSEDMLAGELARQLALAMGNYKLHRSLVGVVALSDEWERLDLAAHECSSHTESGPRILKSSSRI